MLAATLIAIFLIPLLFVLFERLALKLRGRSRTRDGDRCRGEARHDDRGLRQWLARALTALVAGRPRPAARVGPELQAAGQSSRPTTFRGRRAGRRRRRASLGDEPLGDGVRGRAAAAADHDGAGAELRRAHRGVAHLAGRGAVSGSRAPTSSRPSTGQASAQGQQRHRRRRRRRCRRPASCSSAPALSWELDFWGKFRRATEAARARDSGERMGPPRDRHQPGQPGRDAATSRCARSISSSRSPSARSTSRQESLRLTRGPRARRRHVARRRASGRAARVYGARPRSSICSG